MCANLVLEHILATSGGLLPCGCLFLSLDMWPLCARSFFPQGGLFLQVVLALCELGPHIPWVLLKQWVLQVGLALHGHLLPWDPQDPYLGGLVSWNAYLMLD
jgi:hypothetical protein